MKKRLAFTIIAGQISSTVAFADTGMDLAKVKNCLVCHAIDKTLAGPAYKDVAAKYKGDKTIEGKLVEKVQKGDVGVWGQIPNIQVSPAEAKTLVSWVISQH